ncbi:MarR family transcriptional regulator [Pantoea vagans]|uniref:MarR family winged helix-turn-helix transcriptional regulator n=1 Tax=Pantoea vagans TaxID=470934 RepID=UPI000BACAD6D|nr:MarR family transcriptional regulator [Pantoea vagans]PAW33653.1 MarR family transcriptional regulator [Pantoea vagans]
MKNTPEVNRSEDAPSQKLEQQLCFALYSASLAMTKLYQSYLKLLGLTYPQYLVMMTLWEKDGVTVSEVGRRVQLESGTLSQLLKRLEQACFISRVRDTGHDERRVIIRLTEAGRELESRAAGVPAAMTGEIGVQFETLAGLRDGAKHVQEKIVQALSRRGNDKS